MPSSKSLICFGCSPELSQLVDDCLKMDPVSLVWSGGYGDAAKKLEKALKGCESAVQEYMRIIAALQVRRNACPAVFRLPDELFELIFWKTIDDKRGSLSIVPLTHVCRRWRAIALQSPRLWSSVVATEYTKVSAVDNLITRSGDVILDFAIPTNMSPSSPVEDKAWRKAQWATLHSHFSLMLRQLFRIGSLTFKLIDPSLITAHTHAVGGPPSRLHSVDISYGFDWGVPQRDCTVLGTFPSLRDVKAAVETLPQAMSLLRPTVTNLNLNIQILNRNDTVLTSHILQVIAQMPLLETLILCIVPEIGTEDEIRQDDCITVSLPRLKKLSLKWTIRGMALLLRFLQFSPRVALSLDDYFGDSSAEDLQVFNNVALTLWSSNVRHFTQRQDPFAFASVRARRSLAEPPSVRLWNAASSPELRSYPVPNDDDDSMSFGYLELNISLYSHVGIRFAEPSAFLRVIQIDAVEGLESPRDSYDGAYMRQAILDVLTSLHTLEVLVLTRWEPRWLGEVFGHVPPGDVLLPNLKTLVIVEMPFAPADEQGENPQELAPNTEEAIVVLEETLRSWLGGRDGATEVQLRNCRGLEEERILDLGPGVTMTRL